MPGSARAKAVANNSSSIDVLAVVNQGTLTRDRMHDEQSGDVNVSKLAPKNTDANTAGLSKNIAGDSAVEMPQRGVKAVGELWYADTTREPIRDETL